MLAKESGKIPEKTRKYSNGVILLICITSFFIIMGIYFYFESKDNLPGVIASAIIGSIFALATYINFQNDQKAINIQSISDSKKFFVQYFNSLKSNRAKYLYHAVSPLGKPDKSIHTFPFKKIPADKSSYNISSVKGFIGYWRSTFNLNGGNTKSIKFKVKKDIKVIEEYDDKVIFEINLTIASYKQILWALVLLNLIIALIAIAGSTKREQITIRKTLFKFNDKWFMAEGELQGNLDLATFKSE